MLGLTGQELLWFGLLLAAIVLQLYLSLSKKDIIYIWSPVTVITLTYIYYAVIGPIKAVAEGDTVVRTIEQRPYLATAWEGAFISYLFILIGFYLFSFKNFKKSPDFKANKNVLNNAKYIFLFAFLLLFAFGGPNFISKINVLDTGSSVSSEGISTSFAGYFMQSIIFFIVPVLLSLKLFLDGRNKLYFIFFFFIAVSIFINQAFRYRLVILIISFMFCYHLYLDKKLNLKLIVLFIVPFFLLMGLMEVARNYGKGINIQKASRFDTEDYINSSFNETQVFLATGYEISMLDKNNEHTQFAFIINTIAMPIPRAFWPNKPAGEYLQIVGDLYEGRVGGQATLNYGEYFEAFGWGGIVVFSFLIGVFSKYIWCWFKANNKNYWTIVTYSIICAMMYVLVSRGYLAQYITLLTMSLIPVFLIRLKLKRL